MISFYEKYNLDISNLLNVDFLTLPEEDITNVNLFIKLRLWMPNISVKSASELLPKNSKSFSILDLQIYGFHLKNAGPQHVSSTHVTTVENHQLIKEMTLNLKSNMDLVALKLSLVKMLLNLLEFKLKMFNSEKPPLYQVF